MNEVPGLVSIIIPAYNAENFISETFHSIRSQTYPLWEIIVVNDGSTDKSGEIARSFANERIKVIDQKNSGVSAARNNGLAEAKGEFVCFFDADDLMTPDFLRVRVDILSQKAGIGFVGGMVETFPGKKPLRQAVAADPEKEILFFDDTKVTIPSNYLFRTSVLRERRISFNPGLSSTADRFFILQVAKNVKGVALNELTGNLRYRISETSMSHQVNPKLVFDNYTFYKELNQHQLFPQKKKRALQSRFLFSLALSFFLVKQRGSGLLFLGRSFLKHPLVFSKLLVKRISRRPGKTKDKVH